MIVLAFLAIYPIKIHDQLEGIRHEQVKNQLYADPNRQITDDRVRRRLETSVQETSVQVRGSVNVEGRVEVQEPL